LKSTPRYAALGQWSKGNRFPGVKLPLARFRLDNGLHLFRGRHASLTGEKNLESLA
jgi:hypothetical protein